MTAAQFAEVERLIAADSAFDEKVTVGGVPAAKVLARQIRAALERKR